MKSWFHKLLAEGISRTHAKAKECPRGGDSLRSNLEEFGLKQDKLMDKNLFLPEQEKDFIESALPVRNSWIKSV